MALAARGPLLIATRTDAEIVARLLAQRPVLSADEQQLAAKCRRALESDPKFRRPTS